MDRRVLVAAAVSLFFMAIYSQWLTQRYPQASRPPAARPARLEAQRTPAALPPLEEEPTLLLTNPLLEVEIGQKSAAIRRVALRTFHHSTDDARPLTFGGRHAVFAALVPGISAWSCASSSRSVSCYDADPAQEHHHISYSLDSDKPLLHIELTHEDPSEHHFLMTWDRSEEMSGRQNLLELIAVQQVSQGKLKYRRLMGSPRTEKDVPRGTLLLTLSERHFCVILDGRPNGLAVSHAPSPEHTIAARVSPADRPGPFRATLYAGPRDYFALKQVELAHAFPLGIMGRIGLILLLALSWLARLTGSYGVAIVLFSIGITTLLAPFTLLSFKSMRKMQELKPQIDQIMAKHKNDQPRASREMFALYKQHRVSPLSGCLPMLMQLPIFIALFQGLSHFVHLRGQGFLWIKDLSLPDQIATLPVSLPLLGAQVNLLPILMAALMYFQSRLTQVSMPSQQDNPMAKAMSGPFMSVIFGLMFYSFPSGLVLYWMMNSLTSLVWYRLAK